MCLGCEDTWSASILAHTQHSVGDTSNASSLEHTYISAGTPMVCVAETCPYRVQVRESSWPSNFPDVGRCEHKESVDQMANNAGQILKGPRKKEPIDDPLIHDIILVLPPHLIL